MDRADGGQRGPGHVFIAVGISLLIPRIVRNALRQAAAARGAVIAVNLVDGAVVDQGLEPQRRLQAEGVFASRRGVVVFALIALKSLQR